MSPHRVIMHLWMDLEPGEYGKDKMNTMGYGEKWEGMEYGKVDVEL